jgi:hypothetical protein
VVKVAMKAEIHFGWIALICPKCGNSNIVGRSSFKKFFLQDHFWRRAVIGMDIMEPYQIRLDHEKGKPYLEKCPPEVELA